MNPAPGFSRDSLVARSNSGKGFSCGLKVNEMTAVEAKSKLCEKVYFGIVSAILFCSAASTALSADNVEAAANDTEEIRVSRSLRNPERIREQYAKLEKQQDKYQALSVKGMRSSPSKQQNAGNDFWFYTADVVLFNDDDFDGFYWGIDLLFDADTYYDAADVYAVLYLSLEGGPWNEYAVTDTFTIYGATSDDEYVMVTELMSGYPTGYYDILIELFDAYDGAFLASFGPGDTSELSFLPLEDFNRDDPGFDAPVVINHGGGGASDWWILAAMLLLWLGITLRNDRKRRQEAEIRWRKLD